MKPKLHEHTWLQLQGPLRDPIGSYVFYGPSGIGRATTARWLLRSWHGHADVQSNCQRCRQIDAETYPDLIQVSSQDKSLGIAEIQTLIQRLHTSRHDTVGYRLVVIDQAGQLTIEAQNALLKLLEEPPTQTVVIILAGYPQELLETIRSRVQPIYFLRLNDEQVEQFLTDRGVVTDTYAFAGGLIGIALQLAQDSTILANYQGSADLVRQLCETPLFNRLILAGQIGDNKTLDIQILTQQLERILRLKLRSLVVGGSPTELKSAVNGLKALERFNKQLQSNVSFKSALSGLVLEL